MFDEDTLAKASLDLKKEEDHILEKESLKQKYEDITIPDKVLQKEEHIPTRIDYNIYAPLIKDLKHKYIPRSIWTLMGCDGCEWKGTEECPHGITKKDVSGKHKLDPTKNIKHRHGNGICNVRKDYLYWIGGEWDKRPTHDMWMSRFNKRVMAIQSNQDYTRMKKIQHKLELAQDFHISLDRIAP